MAKPGADRHWVKTRCDPLRRREMTKSVEVRIHSGRFGNPKSELGHHVRADWLGAHR
jgi:hypothetical protein